MTAIIRVSNPKGIKFYVERCGVGDRDDRVSNPKGIKFYMCQCNFSEVAILVSNPKGIKFYGLFKVPYASEAEFQIPKG